MWLRAHDYWSIIENTVTVYFFEFDTNSEFLWESEELRCIDLIVCWNLVYLYKHVSIRRSGRLLQQQKCYDAYLDSVISSLVTSGGNAGYSVRWFPLSVITRFRDILGCIVVANSERRMRPYRNIAIFIAPAFYGTLKEVVFTFARWIRAIITQEWSP